MLRFKSQNIYPSPGAMVVTLPLEQFSRLFTRQMQLIFPGTDLRRLWEDENLKTKVSIQRAIIFIRTFQSGIMSAGLHLIVFSLNHQEDKICISPVHTCQLMLSSSAKLLILPT